MKSNALLKWLMLPVIAMALLLMFRGFSGKNPSGAAPDGSARLTAEEMKALGIEGDTPRDTLATLVGQVKQLRQELQDTQLNYQQQSRENERLRSRESSLEQRIENALTAERERLRERLREEREHNDSDKRQTAGMLEQLQRRLEGVSNRVELPVGLGLEPPGQAGEAGEAGEALQWSEPLDAWPAAGQSGRAGSVQAGGAPTGLNPHFTPHFATRFTAIDSQEKSQHAGERIAHAGDAKAPASLKPVYTLPANAILMGSVAMTALIGRVPVDGTVNDPYPFKVLVGADNLTANGIEIPDVAGMVLSGMASGDWTLSCVRGQIDSLTFVFHDGTIRTVTEPGKGQGSNANRGASRGATTGGLGWISDSHGIPCVSGERKSNAAEYIGNQSLITAAGAGVAYLLRNNDNASYANVGEVTSGADAIGQILQGGVKDISSWMNKLYGQAFAAVYVAPGAQVAVHLDQEIGVDYDRAGRRVDHRNGGNNDSELD
jgi:integrating conjugative element protein (TIGR03752 family)